MRKKSKILSIIAFASAAAVIISCFVVRLVIVSVAKNRIAWSEKMQAEGPWKEKAIWKSPDNDFYLICNQYNETDGITVSAYVQVESEWIKCYPGSITGPKRLFFDTNDGTYSNDFFDCAAVLENDRLILSDIACDNGYFKTVDKIVLVKCDYADVFDSLPFETVD